MKKTLAALVAVIGLAIAAASPAQAQGPSSQCNGQIIAGISATWPWAHNGRTDFAPPPGAIALWLQIFGPLVGVSSVRDLQILFCTS
jgi:hypothetical protein